MGSYHITVLKGDGIGPDVVTKPWAYWNVSAKNTVMTLYSMKSWQAAVRMMRMASPCLRNLRGLQKQ